MKSYLFNTLKVTLSMSLLAFFSSCTVTPYTNEILVSNAEELNNAISKATPGTDIIMKNGEWTDIQIKFSGAGTDKNPIRLRAETSGSVIVNGLSDLKLGD